MPPGSFTVRLYEHIKPLDRGDRYEDPLQAALEAQKLGSTDGGGSLLSEVGEIEFAEIEVDASDVDRAAKVAVATLEGQGAPQGSELRSGDKVLHTFGQLQCLAIYLDGVSLPDEVYANLDFNALTTELGQLAGPESYRGFWQGPQETGLYFFGRDADDMLARVHPRLLTLPIGQNARVVVRRGKSANQPREIRIPRHSAA